MQVENNYDRDVYNGDLGIVTAIDAAAGGLAVDFDGRVVGYESSELDQLTLAYATTIHKSQGSEYTAVVMPLTTQHYPMLQRNLVYTGVTRGKRLVVIVGQKRALAMAVRGGTEAPLVETTRPSRRFTRKRNGWP
jgi:exodeoxyribonuclease V alpha subunit